MSNYLVVAIDTQLRDELAKKGANVYYKDIQARSHVDFFLSVVQVCSSGLLGAMHAAHRGLHLMLVLPMGAGPPVLLLLLLMQQCDRSGLV